MGEFFYWLLNMSITASLVGIAVLLLRKIPAIRRSAVMLLWLFPFLRLCIPIGFGSRLSIMTLFTELMKRSVTVRVPVSGMPENVGFYAMNHVALADSYSPFVYKTALLERVFNISFVIWLAVAATGVAFVAYCYSATVTSSKKAVLLRDNIYIADGIASPVLVGIIRPRVLIPESMKDRDIQLILLHESTHARRGDNLWRLIAVVIAVVHWFNPFVWIFLRLFLCDMEYACDESVLSKIGDERRREYAGALIDSAKTRSLLSSAFGGAALGGRIKGILGYRKITVFSAACLAVFVAVLGVVLMTNSM